MLEQQTRLGTTESWSPQWSIFVHYLTETLLNTCRTRRSATWLDPPQAWTARPAAKQLDRPYRRCGHWASVRSTCLHSPTQVGTARCCPSKRSWTGSPVTSPARTRARLPDSPSATTKAQAEPV